MRCSCSALRPRASSSTKRRSHSTRDKTRQKNAPSASAGSAATKRRANGRVLTRRYPGDPSLGTCRAGRKGHWMSRWYTLHCVARTDARSRSVPKRPAWSSDRSVPPGLHRRPVAPRLRHQLADAAPAAAAPGRRSRHPTVIDNLSGGVLWAQLSAQKRAPKDYWARVSHAEWCALLNPKTRVQREYRSAVAAAATRPLRARIDARHADAAARPAFRPDETPPRWNRRREIARLEGPGFCRARCCSSRATWSTRRPADAAFSGGQGPRPAERIAAGARRARRGRGRPAAHAGRGRRRPALRRGLRRARRAACNCCCRCPSPSSSNNRSCRRRTAPNWRRRYFELKAALSGGAARPARRAGPAAARREPFERGNRWLLAHCAGLRHRTRSVSSALWDGGRRRRRPWRHQRTSATKSNAAPAASPGSTRARCDAPAGLGPINSTSRKTP